MELKKTDAVIVATLAVLLFYLYGWLGNAEEVEFRGHSAILWMVQRWGGAGGSLSHGWTIPVVSAFIVWWKRKELVAASGTTNWAGLAIIILSLLLHLAGVRVQQTRISLLSLIGLLWGIPLYLYGWRVAKILIFPCAYLIFAIPMSFLDEITVPLRIIASTLSSHLINGLGIPVVRQGTMIMPLVQGGLALGVEEPCSGLRSLLAISAISAVYAWFTQKTLLKQWALFLMALPLAVAGNIARITAVAVVARIFGHDRGIGFYEHYSGYIVFVVAILLMMGIGRLLETGFREQLAKWTPSKKETASQ